MRSNASHPAGPHGRLSPKNGKSGTHCWGREGATQFAQQFVTAVTAPPLVGCVVWSQKTMAFSESVDFLVFKRKCKKYVQNIFSPAPISMQTMLLHVYK